MKYFGTDGVRMKAEEFTPEFITSIVKGLVDYAGDNIKVLIGGDTRESTEWILADIETALETFGIEYSNVGVLPTPAINYCFSKMGFDIAIDVTASHNPYTDNGIKIFEVRKNGPYKLCEEGCKVIEKSIEENKKYTLVPTTIRESLHDDAVDLYKKHLEDYIGDVNFSSLHIGMDCANGATSVINKSIFEKLGAKVELINSNTAYNTEINRDCGSTHLEKLQDLVVKNHLDFGVAFDGDGDRCLLVDKNGEVVDGDEIIAILADFLKLNAVAITVMANQGLNNWAKENNIALEITPVGDANVFAAMCEKNISLGGEQSGHIILPNEPTGDGMLTALLITKVILETGKNLDELKKTMVKLPQVVVNVSASSDQKKALKEKPEVKNLLLAYNQKIDSLSGRLLVRPSGTEPLIRISIWGEDKKEIEKIANELKNELEKIL